MADYSGGFGDWKYTNMSSARIDVNVMKGIYKEINAKGTIQVGWITGCCPGTIHPLLLNEDGALTMNKGWY
ncbi:MAG: hypothetical protein V3U72_02535 [Candidatus Aenigmarchaeota archaeon]